MAVRRGVVLAGGTGTRLRPYTRVLNKHLLPVYDRPMVAYPIETLRRLGATEVCLVTGKDDLEAFRKVLGDGHAYGVSLRLRPQDGPRGVADALLQSESFFEHGKVLAILGDDIFDSIALEQVAFDDDFAYVFLSKATEPQQVAIAEFDGSGRIVGITEKPVQPKSDLMVVGLYLFPPDAFDVIRTLGPSARNEVEISGLTNWYAKQGRLRSVVTDRFVADAGTPEGYKLATRFAASRAASPAP